MGGFLFQVHRLFECEDRAGRIEASSAANVFKKEPGINKETFALVSLVFLP
jgi:hypothetical protein